MAKPRRKRSKGGRFADKLIGKRVGDLRAEHMEPKEFYDRMGWEKGEHSRKVRGLTTIWPGEAGDAADILHAPKGWPYVSVEEGMLIEALGARAAEVLKHLPEIMALLDRPRK